MGNKADELRCLNIAIEKCLKQHGDSKQIAKLLSGEDVTRTIDERPDFVRYYPPQNKKEKGVVIGIEHFRVDHYSKELKNHRVGSFGKEYEKGIKKAVDTWQEAVDNSVEIPNGALTDVGNLMAKRMELHLQSSYNSFVKAFRYSLDKHIESIDKYYSLMNDYYKESEHRLAFLIEIHSDFRNLFFHSKKGVYYKQKIVPVFDEIVALLEKIDYRKVQYIIMCFEGIAFDNKVEVIAVKTRNIRHQLEKRGIDIYKYAGDDMFFEGFQTSIADVKSDVRVEKGNKEYKFNMSMQSRSIVPQQRMELVMHSYRIVHFLDLKKQAFATTICVELFWDLYDEYFDILFDINNNPNIDMALLITQINKDIFEAKYKRFKERWLVE